MAVRILLNFIILKNKQMKDSTLEITIDKNMAKDVINMSKTMPIDLLKRYNGTDIILKFSSTGVYFFITDEVPARIDENVYKYLSYEELNFIAKN